MTKTATIRVPSLKLTLPLPAAALPRDLVPPDGPAGSPELEVAQEGPPLVARARINGKNYRKMLKTVAEHGPANVSVVLQGTLRPPPAEGGPLVLAGAGSRAGAGAGGGRADGGGPGLRGR